MLHSNAARHALCLLASLSASALLAGCGDNEALPPHEGDPTCTGWGDEAPADGVLDLPRPTGPHPVGTQIRALSAEIRAWFEEYKQQLRNEGRDEGRNEGRAEEAARAVLTALRVRGIAVPDAARERILAEKDPETLERWHERAIVAASLAEVLDELS
ncbi:hypothetical protein [Sorangium sp. So ce1000]|uniref:hypothetical protein n=1 Tax=Sorangium sp. So ce1000 TaxID=3133325 RepID=UPI003F5E36CC